MLTFETLICHIFKKRDTTGAIHLFYVYVLLLFKLHHTTNHHGRWASFKIQLHNFWTFSWEVMPCKKLDTNIMTYLILFYVGVFNQISGSKKNTSKLFFRKYRHLIIIIIHQKLIILTISYVSIYLCFAAVSWHQLVQLDLVQLDKECINWFLRQAWQGETMQRPQSPQMNLI